MPHMRAFSQLSASTTARDSPWLAMARRDARLLRPRRVPQLAKHKRAGCTVPRAQSASTQSTPSYLTRAGFVDYYELLNVDDDASPAEIKAAYRGLAKTCHPDLLGDEGHNVCILLNEAYDCLMDEDKRQQYDAQLEQALEDDKDDYTGEPLSKWMANTRFGKNEDPAESRAVFVDEGSCIGCKQCVWLAPATFRMEPEHGRSRVFGQWLDKEDDQMAAIESCPVSCIHWVEKDQLPALEYAMRNLVPRENVGIMMAGRGGPAVDVFETAVRFVKKREANLAKAEAVKRYSAAQERSRREAAEKIAQQQQGGVGSWFDSAMGNMFGFDSLSGAMRSNMGYRRQDGDDERVGRRKRGGGPVQYAEDDDGENGTIPLERALVPVSVAARGLAREPIDRCRM